MDNLDNIVETIAVEKLRYAIQVGKINRELSEHLTSSLQWLLHYSKKHNISLPEMDKILALVDRALEINEKIPTNCQLTRIKSTIKLTVPKPKVLNSSTLKYGIGK